MTAASFIRVRRMDLPILISTDRVASLAERITNAGTFRSKRRLLFTASILKRHSIGIEEVDDGFGSIHFRDILLGRGDERDNVIRGWNRWHPKSVTHAPSLSCYLCSLWFSRFMRWYPYVPGVTKPARKRRASSARRSTS